ncbi:MAG: hypothetical protein AAFW76_04260, partial [Pseudomonadota bacterium]
NKENGVCIGKFEIGIMASRRRSREQQTFRHTLGNSKILIFRWPVVGPAPDQLRCHAVRLPMVEWFG